MSIIKHSIKPFINKNTNIKWSEMDKTLWFRFLIQSLAVVDRAGKSLLNIDRAFNIWKEIIEILNKYNDILPIRVLIIVVDEDFTFIIMEFEVKYIDQPHVKGEKISFRVHWMDGSISEEPLSHLFPGSKLIVNEWLWENLPYITDTLVQEILKYF